MDDKGTVDENEQRNLELVRDKLNEVLNGKPVSRFLRAKIEELIAADKMSLDLLGIKHDTDKASVANEPKGFEFSHDYLRHYEFFFDRYRAEEFALVEFGCYKGASMRMWKEYFPRAEIYGIDLDESVVQYEEDRIHILIGDATKVETYTMLKKALGGVRPFIIIDDASHAWSDQRRSLELFWKMLAPGGFYVVEDLECGSKGAYEDYPPDILDARPFFNYVQDRCSLLRWSPKRRGFVSTDKSFTQLPEMIFKFMITLDSCHFIPGAILMHKNPIHPPWER